MKQGFAVLAALAGAAASVPASAQQDSLPLAYVSEDTPPSPSPTFAHASAIAGEPIARRPLARLRRPLCLVVAGSDQDFAQTVARRIIDNAKAAGVPTQRAGCSANALVTFSDDACAQMEAVRAEGQKVFRGLSEAETDAALASRDPVYVFQSVEPTPRIGQGDAPVGQNLGSQAWTKERSFLRTPEDLLTTMVMIDSSAIEGLSPNQLADYATLRLLAPTGEFSAEGAATPQTILSLFAAPAAAPREMTRIDRAYLRSLYTLPRTAFAEEVLEETLKLARVDQAGSAAK